MAWILLYLGIALNKGVVRDLSILSIVNSWAFAQVLLTLSFLRLPRKSPFSRRLGGDDLVDAALFVPDDGDGTEAVEDVGN